MDGLPGALDRPARPRPSGTTRIGSAVAVVAIAAIVSLGFLPGLMTPDALSMCDQAIRDVYTTWHTPIMTGLWGFFDVRPEPMFVAQVLGFVAAVFLILDRWLRPAAAIAATALVCAVPTVLGWLGHIGKDQWSAVPLLLAIVVLARVPGASERARRRLLVAGGCLLWISVAARSSALPAAVLVLAVAGPLTVVDAGAGRRRAIAAAIGRRAGVVIAFAIVTVGSQAVWTRVVVQPRVQYPAQPTYQYDLAALSVRTGELLIPASSLQPGATLDDIRARFTLEGGGVNGLLFGEGAPVRFMIDDPVIEREIRDAWVSAIAHHPVAYLRHRAAFTLSLLGVTHPYVAGAVFDPGQQPEDWGLTCPLADRYVPELYDAVSWLPRQTDGSSALRMWWVLLVMGGAVAVAGVRRNAEVRMLIGASVGTLAVFAVFGAAPGLRYLWPVSVAAALCVALALARVPALARTRADELPPAPAAADAADPAELADPADPADPAAAEVGSGEPAP